MQELSNESPVSASAPLVLFSTERSLSPSYHSRGQSPLRASLLTQEKRQKTRGSCRPSAIRSSWVDLVFQDPPSESPHLVLLVPFVFLQCTRVLCLQKDPQNWAPSFESLVTCHFLMISWYKTLISLFFLLSLIFYLWCLSSFNTLYLLLFSC